MHKFSLYETINRFYLVGADIMDRRFRILKIDRTPDTGSLNISEDNVVYTKKEMNRLLNGIDDGNKNSGGLQLRCSTWGLLGFIRFTGEYYMLLITKRSQVAMLGGHYIYQVDGTELISLAPSSSARVKVERHPEENRFVGVLKNLDLSRSFYFSYGYDITNTLQRNIFHARQSYGRDAPAPPRSSHNEMFVWNHYLLEPPSNVLKNAYDWCLPIIHGFVDQATLAIYGRVVYITIIARRSRFFAGARFLKRGSNDLGYVANDVETEQIVSEMLTTSFHGPNLKPYANSNYTSYVQHRGSIPLYWTQDNTGVSPKPDIQLNLVDPFYTAAALHFDNLFERYGAPVYVLNLIKSRERTPRESKLLKEFTTCIRYLNQFLPEDKKIVYRAWDMGRAAKTRDQDVIGTLEGIAADVIKLTGFFHNTDGSEAPVRVQNGVARTNCIDCLDRTNAAQFVVGKLALGHQLHALGVIEDTKVSYETDAVNLFTHMYHDHGDTIAIQYGGSHLVNTMETYRKINQWTSHSRDMVESFKRYYNNSFLDGQRQEAYNLFLGNYIFSQGQPMLWDLSTDYYLHHADPRSVLDKQHRGYRQWFDPEHLKGVQIPSKMAVGLGYVEIDVNKKKHQDAKISEGYWQEYYRPTTLTSFSKLFAYRMNSTLRYIPFSATQDGRYDLSPFHIRSNQDPQTPEKVRIKKGVTIADPIDIAKEAAAKTAESSERAGVADDDNVNEKLSKKLKSPEKPPKEKTTPAWLQSQRIQHTGILKEASGENGVKASASTTSPMRGSDSLKSTAGKDKSAMHQWTLNEFVGNSLNPGVTDREAQEYARYISHPLNLPLVVSNEVPVASNLEFLRYVRSPDTLANGDHVVNHEDVADFEAFLNVDENPLTVTEVDTPKKRYKAYRQWLRGKSLFKQSRVDP
jgi:phosphatidylinositol 3,5-bisphosphate 5-phosphatase